MKNPAALLLIEKGNDLLKISYKPLPFTKDPMIDSYLNNLDIYPHFFVLACLMDRQMKAEEAWKIPFYVSREVGSLRFKALTTLSMDETLRIFTAKNLHRFNNIMAHVFYKGVQKILNDYDGYPSRIFRDDLSARTIMNRFLEFEGVGPKIASMATNILIREFKLPIQDRSYIDISADVHVRRVFTRLGLIEQDSTPTEVINCAKLLYPEYPGVFDLPTWEVGRKWCKPSHPECMKCYLSPHCPTNLSSGHNEEPIPIEQHIVIPIPSVKEKGVEKASAIKVNTSEPCSDVSKEAYIVIQTKEINVDRRRGMTGIPEAETERLIEKFRHRIKTEMKFKGTATHSFPGGAVESGDSYETKTELGTLVITVVPFNSLHHRYLHFVRLNPSKGDSASDIEINIPPKAVKKYNTLLAKSNDITYICSRGRCTVNKGSIKKSIVLEHFASNYDNVDSVQENGRLSSVIKIADLDSQDLFKQIASYTQHMKDFREPIRRHN